MYHRSAGFDGSHLICASEAHSHQGVRGFRDAGRVLKGFHHIGTRSKSVNMSALDPAVGRWVSMLVGHLVAGVKDIFRNGAPSCLVIVMICTGGRHESVMCSELVHRLASLQGIECCATHLCESTWGRICSEHCSWNISPRCELAKLRDQNLRNIVELIRNNLLRSLGNSAQTTYLWKCVIPLRSGRRQSALLRWKQQQEAEARLPLLQQHRQLDPAKGSDPRKPRSLPCHHQLIPLWRWTAARMMSLKRKRRKSRRSTI